MHRYSGGEEIPGKTRWALTRGPLLYGALGAPNPLTLHFDVEQPQDWLTPLPGPKNCLRLRGDDAHSYMAYLDIMMSRLMFIPSWKLLVERKRLCTDKKCDFPLYTLFKIHP